MAEKEKMEKEEEEKKVPKCHECGLRIRGENHEQGDHHRGRMGRAKTAVTRKQERV